MPDANIKLILRNAIDKNSHHSGDNGNWNTSTAASEKIMDYAGNIEIEAKTDEYNTQVWPFRGWVTVGGEAIPNNRTQSHARKRYQADDGHHADAWDQHMEHGGVDMTLV